MSPGPTVELDPYVGLEIAHALRLDTAIGVGTTGRVYRASQLGFDRVVAVKVLHRFLMQTTDIRERFHREARLMSKLVHPGIVRVLGSGELPRVSQDSGGEAYLIYEYLEGQTLRECIRARGRYGEFEAVQIVLSIAEAIALAHARQIIHRDLKPENIMSVARDDGQLRYVVLDFGLARALDGDADPLTRAGAVLGTPQYMSPEAARGDPTSPASDVYSLSILLYELVSGRPPFHAGSPIAILSQQSSQEPPPLPEALNVFAPLEAFIALNLSKEPDQRCRDAIAFAAELRSLESLMANRQLTSQPRSVDDLQRLPNDPPATSLSRS